MALDRFIVVCRIGFESARRLFVTVALVSCALAAAHAQTAKTIVEYYYRPLACDPMIETSQSPRRPSAHVRCALRFRRVA
jgi:hypothetical protein